MEKGCQKDRGTKMLNKRWIKKWKNKDGEWEFHKKFSWGTEFYKQET